MKKEYVRPRVMTLICMGEDFILGSKGVTGDNGIEYGGVDDGTHDPAAKQESFYSDGEETESNLIKDIWNDDED